MAKNNMIYYQHVMYKFSIKRRSRKYWHFHCDSSWRINDMQTKNKELFGKLNNVYFHLLLCVSCFPSANISFSNPSLNTNLNVLTLFRLNNTEIMYVARQKPWKRKRKPYLMRRKYCFSALTYIMKYKRRLLRNAT